MAIQEQLVYLAMCWDTVTLTRVKHSNTYI